MDSIICPGCHLSIEPIRVFEQSKRADQWWRITKCPKERCGYNIDIEKCDKPTAKNTKKSDDGDNRRFIWSNGL